MKLFLFSLTVILSVMACAHKNEPSAPGLASLDLRKLPNARATFQESCRDPVDTNIPPGETPIKALADLIDQSGAVYELTSVNLFREQTGRATSYIALQVQGPFPVQSLIRDFDQAVTVTCHNSTPDQLSLVEDSGNGDVTFMTTQTYANEIATEDGKVRSTAEVQAATSGGRAGGRVRIFPRIARPLRESPSRDLPTDEFDVKLSLDAARRLHVRIRTKSNFLGVSDITRAEAIYDRRLP